MAGTALITGCSSGIGRATAEALDDAGWTVYATARTPDDIADLGERGCETARLDVTEQDHVDRVVDRVVDEQGSIDLLVNNAGVAQAGALEEVPTERMEWQFDVNVLGPHRLTRAALPHMREQGDGTIVNVSSIAGRVAQPAMGPYTGTKHAMEGLSDALRVEVAPFGVDVVLVEPGWVQTRIGDKGEATIQEISDADSPYARLHENGVLIKDFMLSDLVAGDVADVAATIRRAAESPDPDPRYVVSLNGRLNMLQRHLPDRVRDWLFEKMFWGPTGQLKGILPGTGD